MGRKLLLMQLDRQCSLGKQARKRKMSEKQLLSCLPLLLFTFSTSFIFQRSENADLCEGGIERSEVFKHFLPRSGKCCLE